MKRVLIRCDVSPRAGSGHLRRCITLARELKERGAILYFAVRSDDFDWQSETGEIADEVSELDWSMSPESDAQEVARLYSKYGVDLAIIDHYRADEAYQKRLMKGGVQWMQFDGAVSYPLWAQWVFNASPIARRSAYSHRQMRRDIRFLLGPKYALLRREFGELRRKAIFRETVERILLTFGGADDRGAILVCLEELKGLASGVELLVFAGGKNPRIAEIRRWIRQNSKCKAALFVDSSDLARRMCRSDLAIIAGGTTTFEAAAMGVPSLILSIADNQVPNAVAWEQRGVAVDLGRLENLQAGRIRDNVLSLVEDRGQRESMSEMGKKLVDCRGAQRTAQSLFRALG